MNEKKKILVAYATAGIGHKKAALAVNEALKESSHNLDIKLIDCLEYTNPFFKRIYCATYLLLINKLIFLWGFFYYLLDIKFVHFLFYPIRRLSHIVNSMRLVNFLRSYKPDVVISTHFLLPDVCDYVKKKYGLKMYVINVLTDYRPHSFWISDGVDCYVGAMEETKEELKRKWCVPDNKIKVMGIPVEPKFAMKHDKKAILKKMKIDSDTFVILLSGGGFGVGPVLSILKELNKCSFPITAINICGHNKALFGEADNLKRSSKVKIINLGYVDNVDELMAVSDICVGKAGGISTTEAFTEDLPFVFVRPIPGQEMRNVGIFTKAGAGIKLKKVSDISGLISKLKFSKTMLKGMKENIGRIKKPNSANNIAEFAKECLK